MTAGRLVRRLLVALLVAAFVAACLRLGWWQWQRFGLTGSGQNLGYTFQWPTFALFAILMWWRLSKLEAQRRRQHASEPAELTSPAKPTASSTGRDDPARPATADQAETSDDPDDELAAYNRYLAQLHAKESNRANRRAD
jgi:DNA-binding transcriptional regulator of glucitol operon